MTAQTQPATIPLDDLFPVADFAAQNPRILSEATLRWQLRNRAQNGLGACCVQLGKKLLISRSRYEAWLATQVEQVAA